MRATAAFICAMQQEFDSLRKATGFQWKGESDSPFRVFCANTGNSVLAATISGIGKSMAAAATQHIIERTSPEVLVSFGLAGALAEHLELGDIVLPHVVLHGDVGVYHRGGFQHPLSWNRHREGFKLSLMCEANEDLLLDLTESLRAHGFTVHHEPLVTCDQVVMSRSRRRELHDLTGACSVDMESGAIGIVAARNGLPFLVVRVISDTSSAEIERGSILLMMQSGEMADRLMLMKEISTDGESRKLLSLFREGWKRAENGLFEAAKALLQIFVEKSSR